eukprot:12509464-Alexandrium_andersonii.AAC.1
MQRLSGCRVILSRLGAGWVTSPPRGQQPDAGGGQQVIRWLLGVPAAARPPSHRVADRLPCSA